MALPNNPTQAQVVKAIKDLENAPAQTTDVQVNGTSITSGGVANIVTKSAYNASTNKIATINDIPDTSTFYPKSGGALNNGAVITMTGGNPYLGLKETSGTQYYLQGYQGEVGISVSGNWGTKRISLDSNGKVFIPSKSIGDGTYTYTLPNKTGTVAMTSDIPSAVTESTVSGWGFTKNAGTITGVQLNGSTIASSGVANVQALPNFSLNISHQTAGNPRPVKFLTVNYNTAATYFKMSATSCHDNGTSYQFLEDIIIGCTTSGTVVCNVYKYCQQAVTYDGATRNYGDVFYVIDTTNKKVDFFILCGQWASSQFTPATKIGNTTIAYITQYTGTATYYSSGTKVWADGDSALYVRTGDLKTVNGNSLIGSGDITITAPAPTNMVTTDTNQTVSGVKTFTGGISVSGRPVGGGDDEGIVVGRATNSYAGVCLGNPNGMRSVFYLTAANQPVWRWNNGTTSYDIVHPNLAGTVAIMDASAQTGSFYATSFYASSDRRLKENIKPAELDCGKVIDDLQIKEFNFIADEDKKVVVGAIAQELQEILPEKYRATLVSGSEDTSYSISEGKLLFVAIGALKEERAKTKELEERLAKLEKMLGV